MDSRSGGKIVTKRYRRHNTTPYDRPAPSEPAPKDPNWLARVIFPATRVIASGASKILSSVFDSDSSSTSSLSSPDSGDVSENDDFNNESHDEADGIHSLNEDHGNHDKNNAAEQVEQLLMQGNFSRQECDRFIEIIKSRALDSSLRGEDDEHFGTENSDNFRNKAVMEAQKWLEQKKVESNPFPNMADEFGSPADVAREYLKSRSPWPSPNSEPFEIQTPATMTSPFQEGTSMAAGHEFSSLFKKRSSLASGSWNIEDEIRSVRAKATEDMLKSSSPSTRTRAKATEDILKSSAPSTRTRAKATEDMLKSSSPSTGTRAKATEDVLKPSAPSTRTRAKATGDVLKPSAPSTRTRSKATEDMKSSLPSTRTRAKATEDMVKPSSPSTTPALPFDAPSSPSTDVDTASRIIAERSTVLAMPMPAIPLLGKHNPKTLGENAASDLSPHSHSNDDQKDSKMDDQSGKLEGTENVDALPTSQAATTLSAENVNGDKQHDETNVNVTVPTEYEGSAFLSEASVEVTVIEETTDSMDNVTNVTVVNSDYKMEVDEMPATEEEEEEEEKKPKPVRVSTRRGGGGRGRGRGRGKGVVG